MSKPRGLWWICRLCHAPSLYLMFVDGRTLPSDAVFSADIAIIGAGAAGITIAKALAHSRLSVLLIESGGLDYDQSTQELNTGTNVGLPYADLTYNRLRFFGGTTGHWGGWCRPLDAIDFRKREGVPYSGWPIEREQLDPYYRQAQNLVEAGPYRYDDISSVEDSIGGKLDFKGNDISLGLYQYSPPTRFGEKYRSAIARAKNIKTLLHTTVLKLETDEDGRAVTALHLGCMNGRRHRAVAITYIIATGGIENARLLLLSAIGRFPGFGNKNGLVGRFFMEHPHVAPARILLTPRERLVLNFMNDFHRGGLHARPCLRPSERKLSEGGLNALMILSMHLEFGADGRPIAPSHPDDEDAEDVALRAAVAKLGRLSRAEGERPEGGGVEAMIELACEQAPNPDSRVTLADDKDCFDLPRIRLNWQILPSDIDAMRMNLVTLGAFMGSNKLGYIKLHTAGEAAWPGAVGWGNHHMGTTRMATSPAYGVVDEHCRVHGVKNLYVAGSSVFPTSGAANPTLTIVALALRLADFLQSVSQ